MKELFANETVRLVVGLLVGVIVIMFINPPHTVCDSKQENYIDTIKPLVKPFSKNLAQCKNHTDLGGCLEVFETIRRLEDGLDQVGQQCRTQLSKEKLTGQWIPASMEILVRAAWGSRPPVNRNAKYGWLEVANVALFCRVKASQSEIFGESAWASFVDHLMSDLPGAETLGRNETWARSIMSDPCRF